MSRQPAAVSRSILAAATAFRMSVVGCLLLAGSHLGVARWGRQEGHEIDGVFRSGSRRANVQPGNQCPRTAAFVSGCVSALGAVRENQSPGVQRLRGAIRKWKAGLSLWQKICWYWGDTPGDPIELGFPPGEI